MQQKDIALIIFASGISAILAFSVGNFVLGGTKRTTTVQTVQAINSNFTLPDNRFFNVSSLNPTKTIQIGDTNNPDPFRESSAPNDQTFDAPVAP